LDFGKKADFTEKNAFFFGFIGYKEIEKNRILEAVYRCLHRQFYAKNSACIRTAALYEYASSVILLNDSLGQ
jgi:hypothetical protein